MRRLGEAAAIQRDDALIARGVLVALNGQRHMAFAEQFSDGGGGRRARRVETDETAQAARRVVIHDDHIDHAVAARLQLEAPVRLQN